ncbi:MAG: endoribonuclease, family (translation initiation inhibitor) [Bacteroidetes bacterium]|nr:endoribonuclease, family (translation initiation inhibitor) [Bacteroidota bacterium]
MRASGFFLLASLPLLLVGCRSNDEEIRRIVRDEIANASMQRTIIKPVDVIGPYSPAVQVGRFLFVSGQIALDSTGTLRNESIEVETRQVLNNLNFILRSAGYDSSHAVSATVYLKNMNDYQKMNLIYGGYFQEGNYPARVAVEVSNLPRQANVEISLIAYK